MHGLRLHPQRSCGGACCGCGGGGDACAGSFTDAFARADAPTLGAPWTTWLDAPDEFSLGVLTGTAAFVNDQGFAGCSIDLAELRALNVPFYVQARVTTVEGNAGDSIVLSAVDYSVGELRGVMLTADQIAGPAVRITGSSFPESAVYVPALGFGTAVARIIVVPDDVQPWAGFYLDDVFGGSLNVLQFGLDFSTRAAIIVTAANPDEPPASSFDNFEAGCWTGLLPDPPS